MEQSINFASDIQREFVSTAGRVDRGVRQAGFWVLAKTSMPAVLVELDFICNPTQERFLNSESGQEKMAKSIYNALSSINQTMTASKMPAKGRGVTVFFRSCIAQ